MKDMNMSFSFVNPNIIYPIEYGFNIEDFRKQYEEKYPKAKVEFSKTDPSPYNMLRVWEDSMINISSNLEEVSRLTDKSRKICQYMTTDEHLETLTIEFDNNFKFGSLAAPGIYKHFQDFIHNYDALGNHLPGIYNGRYSFDASDDYDPHWIYTIGFLDFCLKEMYNMLDEVPSVKMVILYMYPNSLHKISMRKTYEGCICTIRMPGDSFPITKDFFSKMHTFREWKMLERERAKYDVEAKDPRDHV